LVWQVNSVEAFGEGAVSGNPWTKELSVMKNDRIYGINIMEVDVGLKRQDNWTLWPAE